MKRTTTVSAFARTKAAGGRAASSPVPAPAPAPPPENPHANEFEVLAPVSAPPTSEGRVDEVFALRHGTTVIDPITQRVIAVRLHADESLAVVGTYKLVVKKGAVEVNGAVLEARGDLHEYKVFAPTSHALPVITGLRGPKSGGGSENEIVICPSYDGIRDFHMISEAFTELWEPKSGEVEDKSDLKSSFSIVGHHFKYDKKLHKGLAPFLPNDIWRKSVAQLLQSRSPIVDTALKILICGPKGSGKSTMTRYIANKLLSPHENSGKHWAGKTGVFVLDIDPGQPEFGPPGTLSLVHLRSPIFGPSYTHLLHGAPLNTRKDAIIQQHFLGALTPAVSPGTYMECILDLLGKYKNLLKLRQDSHLIINAAGWITGDGLRIFSALIDEISPTVIFHMSSTGPEEAINLLETRCRSSNIVLNLIPTRATPSNRSANVLRSMLLQSYLHMTTARAADDIRWDVTNLAQHNQIGLQMQYGDHLVHGVVFLHGRVVGEELDDGCLKGVIVGIVALESLEALEGLSNKERDETYKPPFIHSTPTGNFPYINLDPSRPIGINPWKSHCLGVGKISHVSDAVYLHTPVTAEDIERSKAGGRLHIMLVPLCGQKSDSWYQDEEHWLRMQDRAENRNWGISDPGVGRQRQPDHDGATGPSQSFNPVRMKSDRKEWVINPVNNV